MKWYILTRVEDAAANTTTYKLTVEDFVRFDVAIPRRPPENCQLLQSSTDEEKVLSILQDYLNMEASK